jgi:hypothetical protein
MEIYPHSEEQLHHQNFGHDDVDLIDKRMDMTLTNRLAACERLQEGLRAEQSGYVGGVDRQLSL